MTNDEIDRWIKKSKLWIQQNSPPKETTDKTLLATKIKMAELKDFEEEDQAQYDPELPPHLYVNRFGIPTVKGFYSHDYKKVKK